MESGVGAAAHIPPKKKDDPADVARALAMAEAVFAHGDHASALKWLQRAAEAASEAQADTRALELAKAAADLANANRQAASADAEDSGVGSTTGVGRSPGAAQTTTGKRPIPRAPAGIGVPGPGRPTMRATPEESAASRTDKPAVWTTRPENAAFSPEPPSSRPGLIGRSTPWTSSPVPDDDEVEEKTRVGTLRYRTTAELPKSARAETGWTPIVGFRFLRPCAWSYGAQPMASTWLRREPVSARSRSRLSLSRSMEQPTWERG